MTVDQLEAMLKLLNEDSAKKLSCSVLIEGAGWIDATGGHFDRDDFLVQLLLMNDDDFITTVPDKVIAIRSKPAATYSGI